MPQPADPLPARIFTIRGHRVIIDTDLARLYGVSTKRFNEAFKRNRHRFPEDFAFQLTREEALNLRSQIATSSLDVTDNQDIDSNWSQSVTSSQGHGGLRYNPWAFTEHGALMAANILRSERAAEMSVYVVRAFVKQREALASNAAILKRLAEIDKTLLAHDSGLRMLWHRLQPLLAPPPPPPEPPKRKIGYHEGNR
ncbi:MAG TPA: ORF6N domain-containing protein [Lacunisphaera sp.]|nr:ORF6N domain-containing protein [Lacunisphaera sp.]